MQPAPIKPPITIEDLNKVDSRVGTIERVDEVPKSDKLMQLTVNFGDQTRSILAGIKKERANPAELEGKQAQQMVRLMEALDDHDDIRHVWSNFDIEEKEIEASLA